MNPLYFKVAALSIVALLFSCMGDKKYNPEASQDRPATMVRYDLENKGEIEQNSVQDVNYFEFMDSRFGMVMVRLPLPSNWKKETGGQYVFRAPEGIKVYADRGNFYMFSNDRQTNAIYQQNGMPIAYPKSIDQVVRENFIPYAEKINRKFLRKYPLPQIAEWDRQYDQKLYSSVPSQKIFNAQGLEWQDLDGTMYLTVLHHMVSRDQAGGYWNVNYSILEAPEKIFEKAKRQYLNGLLNKQINPQWLYARNRREQQIAQKSNIAHQNRMAAIKAAADQSRAHYQSRMTGMDQNMNAWRANQAINDQSHSRYIDNIHGNTHISSPTYDQSYQVEAGANQYWLNNQGEYIMSDHPLYDPNLDQDINHESWTEYYEEN